MGRLAGDEKHYTLSVLDRTRRVLAFSDESELDVAIHNLPFEVEVLEGAPTEHTIKMLSVTEVLDKTLQKDWLMGWAYKEALIGAQALASEYDIEDLDYDALKDLMKDEGYSPWVKRDRKGNVGTQVHEILEALATRKADEITEAYRALPKEARGYADGVQAWWKDQKLRKKDVVAAERLLYSVDHRVAGTVDLIARRGTSVETPEEGIVAGVVLTDLKTSKQIGWDHKIQVATYRRMYQDMGLGQIDACTVLRVGEDGSYEEKEIEDPDQLGRLFFDSLLPMYRALRKREV